MLWVSLCPMEAREIGTHNESLFLKVAFPGLFSVQMSYACFLVNFYSTCTHMQLSSNIFSCFIKSPLITKITSSAFEQNCLLTE